MEKPSDGSCFSVWLSDCFLIQHLPACLPDLSLQMFSFALPVFFFLSTLIWTLCPRYFLTCLFPELLFVPLCASLLLLSFSLYMNVCFPTLVDHSLCFNCLTCPSVFESQSAGLSAYLPLWHLSPVLSFNVFFLNPLSLCLSVSCLFV